LGEYVASLDDGLWRQQTLKSTIGCTGTGLHSGARVEMQLLPAEPFSGIRFRRTDLPDTGEIVAEVNNIVSSELCTRIGSHGGATVATIEHLMAALSGCDVDNVVVELDGPEVPVMDGSAAPFVFLIECAGVVEQDAPRRAIEVLKPVTVTNGSGHASLSPSNGFSVAFNIEFDASAIGKQHMQVHLVNGAFKTEICRARTFGFAEDADQLRANGLALGASLDNAIVIRGEDILNEGGLRYDDEFVRHKILDSIGDLYLAGMPIIGHFHGHRSGHALNHALLQALFADVTAWQLADLPFDDVEDAPAAVRATA
jgi:UDP-3-O-[3-hydroxymyristoyl] N-acetylglucosamine deacetylase